MKVQKTKQIQTGNAPKRKRISKNKETPSNNAINRMDEAFLRFPHLPERIMEKLDFKSLTNSRLIAISWKQFIDEREHRWYPRFKNFKNVIADLKKKCSSGQTPFHLACDNGQDDMVEIIMKNSAKLNIDLNAKDFYGNTAFHLACWNGWDDQAADISEIIMRNSSKHNIDLNAKENDGQTAFHFACQNGHSKVAEMLMKNSVEFNIELNAKDKDDWTAFHYACYEGEPKTVELFINNCKLFKLDLTARNNEGRTGYQVAEFFELTDVVNLIKSRMPSIV